MMSGMVSGSQSNCRSQIRQKQTTVTGIYGSVAGAVFDIWPISSGDTYRVLDNQADYLSANEASGYTEILQPTQTRGYTFVDAGVINLNFNLGLEISLPILGTVFQARLDIQLTTNDYVQMTIQVTNVHTAQHTYEWYLEEGNVMHCWQTE
jgi:ribosomal protein S4E